MAALGERNVEEARELALFALGHGSDPRLYRGEGEDDWTYGILLEEIARMLPKQLAICTVEGGPPAMSSFKNTDPALIVFNSRYQRQLADFRRLLSPAWRDEDREAIATRTFLKGVAELALRKGNGDAATTAFVRAVSIPLSTPDFNQDLAEVLRPLTTQVVDTPYVVSRFYGLAHEAGHIFASQPGHEEYIRERFPDQDLIDALNWCADQRKLHDIYGSDLANLMFGAGSVSLCDPAHLREEASADIFAVSTLIPTAVRAVEQQASRDFHPGYFALECEFMSASIHYVELCRRLASVLGREAEESQRERFGFDVQALLGLVRKFSVRPYLQEYLAQLHFDDPDPTPEQMGLAGSWLETVDEEVARIVPGIRSAMLNVVGFVRLPRDPRQCADDFTALEHRLRHWPEKALHSRGSFGDRLIRSMGGLDYGLRREAQDFVDLARQMRAGGNLVDKLGEMVGSGA